MPIPMYLAMTAAEFRACDVPGKIGWMACHFSPGGKGLTNLPKELPPQSLLILDDSTPIGDHDAKQVLEELRETVQRLDCSGLLLDFERPANGESLEMARKIAALPCPVCVAAEYGMDLDRPIFLPPIPVLKTPEESLRPWIGREIWLDCCPVATSVVVTENGSQVSEAPAELANCPHFDGELLCHYRLDLENDRVVFTLHRSPGDLRLLLDVAQKWGVTQGVGLWLELRK